MSSVTGKARVGAAILEGADRLAAQARSFLRFCAWWVTTTHDSNQIRSITIYPPAASRNGMWLLVAKGFSGGYRLVAFHRASDPLSLLAGFSERVSQAKIEWKADKWHDEGKPSLSR